jgi:hypothetical protein
MGQPIPSYTFYEADKIMAIKIKVSESRKDEAEGLKFLPEELKPELEFNLPSLYRAKSLAIFKGSEDVDGDVPWDAEYMSWDISECTVSGKYLMVALEDNPGADKTKAVMGADYKKAMLPEALELVCYMDVEALRDAFAKQVVDATEGKEYELSYSLSDIVDMGDVPGGIDAAYTDGAPVSCMVGATGFTVAESASGSEIKETKSPAEALALVEEFYNKYKD